MPLIGLAGGLDTEKQHLYVTEATWSAEGLLKSPRTPSLNTPLITYHFLYFGPLHVQPEPTDNDHQSLPITYGLKGLQDWDTIYLTSLRGKRDFQTFENSTLELWPAKSSFQLQYHWVHFAPILLPWPHTTS